jgi:hypothetical protein
MMILFLVFNATFSNISAISWLPVFAKNEKKHHKVCQEKKRTIKGYGSAARNRLTK